MAVCVHVWVVRGTSALTLENGSIVCAYPFKGETRKTTKKKRRLIKKHNLYIE
jgi:hypothetical protein